MFVEFTLAVLHLSVALDAGRQQRESLGYLLPIKKVEQTKHVPTSHSDIMRRAVFCRWLISSSSTWLLSQHMRVFRLLQVSNVGSRSSDGDLPLTHHKIVENLSLAIWALSPVSELVVNTNRSAVTLQFAHRLPHFPDRDTPILQAETHSFTHTRNFQTGVLRQAGAKLWRTLAPQGLSFETPVLDLWSVKGRTTCFISHGALHSWVWP